MSNYLLLLGTASALCRQETQWLLGGKADSLKPVSTHFYQASLSPDQLNLLASHAAGVIKIARIISDRATEPAGRIISLLQSQPKVNFAVIGPGDKSISQTVKQALKDLKVPVRFTLVADYRLTAYSLQSHYHEFWLIPSPKGLILAQMVFCQNLKNWAFRDLGRPKSDPKSGMLPPKIARIMVNLSLPPNNQTQTVYDPFCGSGTILAEALMLGHSVIGSDQSQKAVNDTTDNLYWLKTKEGLPGSISVFSKDATQLIPSDLPNLPNSIVFEPYLGPPHFNFDRVNNLAKGLQKLYLGALKKLSRLQTSGQRLVCILPDLKRGQTVKTTAGFIDRCENFGYTLQAGPLSYSRPQASIIRQIYVLVKN